MNLCLSRKYEEVYPPNAAEFAYVTDNAYTKKQVLKIEDFLLDQLDFEVCTVTTNTFLLHYLKLAEVDEVTNDLARVRHYPSNDVNECVILRIYAA
jgi:hypothetical protein